MPLAHCCILYRQAGSAVGGNLFSFDSLFGWASPVAWSQLFVLLLFEFHNIRQCHNELAFIKPNKSMVLLN